MARKATLTDDDKREIAESYQAGMTWVELARKYRCRFYLIKSILADAGVGPRQTVTANTPIERRLHDALMAAGIGFATQKRLVGRYIVDISVHQAPVIIEADGARHRASAKARERDAARDAAHEAAGYRIFHFSGSEINTDAEACIQQVINACGLVADENPVYDIRTKFSGKDHPRYVGGHQLICRYCGMMFWNYRAMRKYCCHEHFILDAVKGKSHGPERAAKSRASALAASRKASELARQRRLGNQIKIESDPARERRSTPETWVPATLF